MEQFQLFPVLDPATEAALRASIERWGVLVPVVKDQHGRILDGYHRSRIATELGVDYPITTLTLESDADRMEIARTLNADRRHLDRVQRIEVEKHLRELGHSLRAIAGAVGVSEPQVHHDLSGDKDLSPEVITGRDGKSYPATRPAPPPLEESMAVLDATASALDVLQAEQVQRAATERRVHESSSAEMNELRDACRRLLTVLVTVEQFPAHEQAEAGDWIRELKKELDRHA